MHSPANATNARPVITLIPAFLFVLITRQSNLGSPVVLESIRTTEHAQS